MKLSEICDVVGLDVYLKKTQVTIMNMNGEVVKKERFDTCKADLQRSLECVPKGSKVAVGVGGFLLALDRFFRGAWAQRVVCQPVTAR